MRGIDALHSRHLLYPHDADDFVFLIYQTGRMRTVGMKSTAIPILQWLIIILLCSLVLYALRLFAGGRNTIVSYLLSFTDSVAIFMGSALNKISNNRPERCFIICFSIFGLIFKSIFTGNLFVMYQMQDENRIRTINQLNQLGIIIIADGTVFPVNLRVNLCQGKPV